MQIILLERVEKLGQLGDVVTVKPGYARNFLLPQGKALRANKANLEKFEQERADLEKRNADERSSSEALAKNMENLSVNLVRAASEMGQLFGSVSGRDIASAVTEAGHAVDKRQVVMDKAIKTLGLFPIRINLHSEVAVTVTVNMPVLLKRQKHRQNLVMPLSHLIMILMMRLKQKQTHQKKCQPKMPALLKQKLKRRQVMQMLRLMTLPLKTQQKKHLRIQKRPSLFSAPQIFRKAA